MGYLTQQHLLTTDPFLLGTSAGQAPLMMPLTQGRLFPWFEGGALLLRRVLYPTPGLWEYCGVATPKESSVSNYAGFFHAADQAYHYTCVRSLGNGFVSRMAPPIRVDFDAMGELISPALPAWPREVVAVPIVGGGFAVSFMYDPLGQGAYPSDFQVFEGADAASVDYDTPLVDAVTGLDHVSFSGGRTQYTFTTAAFGDGTDHVFVVRGRNGGGVAEQNTFPSPGRKARVNAPAGAAAPRDARVRLTSRRPR